MNGRLDNYFAFWMQESLWGGQTECYSDSLTPGHPKTM